MKCCPSGSTHPVSALDPLLTSKGVHRYPKSNVKDGRFRFHFITHTFINAPSQIYQEGKPSSTWPTDGLETSPTPKFLFKKIILSLTSWQAQNPSNLYFWGIGVVWRIWNPDTIPWQSPLITYWAKIHKSMAFWSMATSLMIWILIKARTINNFW